MKITVTRTYLGAINLKEGKVIVSDPCYEPDIWCNQENWIVGGAVKEKYPNTNKTVVIEFTRQEKEQQ